MARLGWRRCYAVIRFVVKNSICSSMSSLFNVDGRKMMDGIAKGYITSAAKTRDWESRYYSLADDANVAVRDAGQAADDARKVADDARKIANDARKVAQDLANSLHKLTPLRLTFDSARSAPYPTAHMAQVETPPGPSTAHEPTSHPGGRRQDLRRGNISKILH
jgi:hypothetical protein